jgi:signal transduction histidine kinase/ligand-binding sensor domain-containing protein
MQIHNLKNKENFLLAVITKIPINKLANLFPFILSFLLLLFISKTCNLSAQNYESHFTKITDEKGDAPSATFSIVEDSRGFIWFGTVDGLYRYDGYNFKIYRFRKDDTNSLSNNTIRALAIDREDKIWIATQGGGLNVMDTKTEIFRHFIHSGKSNNEINGNEDWSVALDRKGNVWVGITGKGVDRYNPISGQFNHYLVLPGDSTNQFDVIVRSLMEDSQGIVWVGTSNNGISEIDPEKGLIWNYHALPADPNSIASNTVYDIYEDKDGQIWAATFGGGINIFNKKTKKFVRIRQDPKTPNSLISDLAYHICKKKSDEFLIATQYGMSEMNFQLKKFNSYRHDECNPNSLSEDRLRTIFEDKNGIIWIGSESGVDKLIRYSKFLVYKHSDSESNSIEKGIVRSIMVDKEGTIWAGLIDRGLVQYSRETNRFKTFLYDPSKPKGLPGNHITALLQGSEGQIWIGEWDFGLYHYLKGTGFFEPVVNNHSSPAFLTDNHIQFIREAKPGLLWLGTERGLNLYDIRKNTCLHFVHEPDKVNSLAGNSLQSNAFVQEANGDVWVGTWASGLSRIHFTQGEYTKPIYTNWKNDPTNSLSLNNNNVISLLQDKNGLLWIGTFGGGLDCFDPSAGSFRHFTTNDGLPNNIVYAIQEDTKGNLWLSTDKGISKFSPKENSFQNFGKEDGLQDDHFFWGSSFKSKTGEIFFGGINGMNSFYPDKIEADKYASMPVLIYLKKFSESDTISLAISGLREIDLPYNDNFLSFEFSALDFHEPYKNQYQYFLEGFDSKWTLSGNRRYASYTNLPHGTYTFHLKASNYDRIANNNELIFLLRIHAPWWKTWWAKTLLISIFTIIAAALYYLRIGILEKQKRKLENQVKWRTAEIENKNLQLEDQQGKISRQNDILNDQKNELSSKNSELQQTLVKLELAQKALIEAEKMASLGILSAGVAHEINNPLNFISVSIQNIKTELEELEKQVTVPDKEKMSLLNQLIDHSETGVERIANIVKSLRSFTHRSDGNSDTTIIKELIETALTILSSKIPSFIFVEKKFGDLPSVLCKQDQLVQVLINIIDNAIDAISEKSEHINEKIIIETGTRKLQGANYVYIGIFNTGNQIPREMTKHLFDPFFTTKDPNKGTGLGLYISYNIIKDHRGKIEVENKSDGVLFKLYLPL